MRLTIAPIGGLGLARGLVLFALFLPTAAAFADTPVLRVGKRQYTLEELFGSDEKKLRAAFDAEVKQMPDDRVRFLLRRYLAPGAEKQWKEPNRAILVETLWKGHLRDHLEQAAMNLLKYQTVENILQEHESKIGDYFDLDIIKDATHRSSQYFAFLDAHRDDPAEKDAERFAEAVRTFRLWPDKDRWKLNRDAHKEIVRFQRLYMTHLRCLDQLDDARAKGLLLNPLLREVCEKGYYYEWGAKYFQLRHSAVSVIQVEGYTGSRQALEDFFAEVIGKDGDVAEAGVRELRSWLKPVAPRAEVKQARPLGAAILDGWDLPVSGRLYETAPNSYRVSAFRMPKRPSDDDKRRVFYVSSAYDIAVGRFLPELECYVSGVTFKADKLMQPMLRAQPSQYLPDILIGDYVKKPYPTILFEEPEQQRARLCELAVTAARAAIRRDAKAGKRLQEQARQQAEQMKTPAVRRAYRQIADRLEAALKEAPK